MTITLSQIQQGAAAAVPLPVSQGGTSATSTVEALSTLGAQPVDADLTAIASLAGTIGLLKKTAADTWSLDTTAYTTNAGDVTLAGTQTLTNKTITETVFVVTGTTPALTATNGAVQTWTLSAASTPTDSLTTGQSIILVITPGAFAITWPSVVWTKQGGSGALPTLFTAGKTVVVLWKVGTTLYGSHLGDTA